tara:strand:- start:690 stop:1664 length:975 start_codon:yes stop_codon:yes gene_type:complete
MYAGKRILIVDQLNLFFRNYIVNPSLSTNGQPIGALKGCFQSLQKVIRESKPDVVVICWDGAGGSAKRKSLKKDYKSGRKPIRLNRAVRNMSEDEEIQNKIWQQTRLIEYYNQTPIVQFMFDGIEADDVIAYICTLPGLKEAEKLILSSDKDFFQLLDDKTILSRPIQKQVLNKKALLQEYGIHPNNFAMARAMAGDKSDNLPGLGGIGLKTAAKRFPFLREEEPASFEKVLGYCKEMLENKEIKAYRNLLEQESTLRENYKIMQLYAPMLTIESKKTIHETLESPDFAFNKTELLKMMIQDGFGEINFTEIFQHFNKLCVDNS